MKHQGRVRLGIFRNKNVFGSVNKVRDIRRYIYRSVFGILTFCFAEFDTSVICHAVIMLCLGSFLLQNMSLNVGFQFEGRSLKYSVSMFQKKVDN